MSPRKAPTVSREEKKAQTRARLLDAAASVFARKGFAGASLDDVADEAGLTKGAVYSNFASKDDLIAALIEERIDRPQLGIADTVDLGASREEQAEQAGHLLMEMSDRERETHLLALEYYVHLVRNPHLKTPGKHREAVTAMADLMQKQADDEGRTLPLPAYDLAIGLFALGQGIINERLLNPEDVPEDLFGRMIAVIFGLPTDQPPAGEKR